MLALLYSFSLLCRLFSRCGKQELLSTCSAGSSTVWLLLAERRLQVTWASAAAAPGLQSTGQQVWFKSLAASWRVGPSQTRGQTPCLLHRQVASSPLRQQGSPQPSQYLCCCLSCFEKVLLLNISNIIICCEFCDHNYT